MSDTELTLVVPCFNEASRFPFEAFESWLGDHARARMIFVDDGSTDGTADVLDELRRVCEDRCTVVSLDSNRGKAEAVRTGLLAAAADGREFIGYWDADLATPLDSVPELLQVLR